MSDTLNWQEILQAHVIFRELEAQEIDALLRPHKSRECVFETNDVILKEGDVGDSIYLIGEGEVSVAVTRHGSTKFTFATLSKGDIFGELAFFDQKPRSATIIAKGDCVVREFKAQSLRDMLVKHPTLEFKMNSMLSERLRRVTEGVLQFQLREVDDRFNLLNSKLEAELKIFDNAVKTTQALFDATNERVKELSDRAAAVIQTTQKSQDKISKTFKWIVSLGTPVTAILAFFGVQSVLDIMDKARQVDEQSKSIITKSTEAEALLKQLKIQKDFFEPKYFQYVAVDYIFFFELDSKKISQANDTFYNIISMDNEKIQIQFLSRIMNEIITNESRRSILEKILKFNVPRLRDKHRFLAYYLLLAAYVLDGETKEFEELRTDFQSDLKIYTGRSIRQEFVEEFRPEYFQQGEYGRIFSRRISEIKKEDVGKNIKQIEEEARELARKRTEKIEKVWKLLP